jgi:predicted metalloenzyme YecM
VRRTETLRRLVGDYVEFFTCRLFLLSEIDIDVSEYPISHLAVRVGTYEDYLDLRDAIEKISKANVENVWSGRPISKLLLTEPVPLGPKHELELIELIPPIHDGRYPMGIEHLGFVIGAQYADFRRLHADVLTGQQDQGPLNRPLFVRFDDERSVKFHRLSLHDVVVAEGRSFDGFHHSEGPGHVGSP